MMIVRHARTHIYIGWATLYPIGRVILLQQKALYNIVNLSVDIYMFALILIVLTRPIH
jgi:hypothetical protein